MTSKQQLSDWFDSGVEQGAAHMIVVCDTFDHDDYPVYTNSHAETLEKYDHYNGKNMQRVMEVYDLALSKAEQMAARRVFHFPPPPTDIRG